jgi:hypothetical protein
VEALETMSTFKERLEQRWYQAWGVELEERARAAHPTVDPGYLAGARAALSLAAEELKKRGDELVATGDYYIKAHGAEVLERADWLRSRAEELK